MSIIIFLIFFGLSLVKATGCSLQNGTIFGIEDALQIFDLINDNTHNMSQPPCVSNYNSLGGSLSESAENERWVRLEYSQRHAQPPQLGETKAFEKLDQSLEK